MRFLKTSMRFSDTWMTTRDRLSGFDVDESLSPRFVRFALKLKKAYLEAKQRTGDAANAAVSVSTPPSIREKVVDAFFHQH
jgi:hypothetical protein